MQKRLIIQKGRRFGKSMVQQCARAGYNMSQQQTPTPTPSPWASITAKFKIGDIIQDINWGYEGEVIEVLSKDYRIKTASKIFHLIPHEDALATVLLGLTPNGVHGNSVQMTGWGNTGTPKFKIGDKIKNKTTNQKGEIRSVDTLIDEHTYWTWYTDEGLAKYTKESDLELVASSPTWGPQCDCGAKHTSNQNLHSHWCSRFGRD